MKSGIRPQALEKSQKSNKRRGTFIPDSRAVILVSPALLAPKVGSKLSSNKLGNKKCESDGMYFLIEFNLVGRRQTNDCNVVTSANSDDQPINGNLNIFHSKQLPKDKIIANKDGHTFDFIGNKKCESDGMYFLIEFNLVGRGQTNDCNIVTTNHLLSISRKKGP